MDKVRFAVVGVGLIGHRHMAMINENADAELCAVCDIRPRAELDIPDELPLFRTIADLLAHHPEVEVVNICTPNGLHAAMAIEVLNAGRHVTIEKPMALSTADARAVIDAEQRSGRRAFVVLQNRYSPSSQWLRGIVDEHRLGDILMVNLNCMWNRDERYYSPGHWHGTLDMDGGPLFTQYSHFIDLLCWLFGPLHSVEATRFECFTHSKLTDFEDSGSMILRLGRTGKTLATVTYSTSVWDTNAEISMTVVGTNGTVKISGRYMNEVTLCHIKDYTMPALPPADKPNDYAGYKGSAANHQYVIQNIIDTLRHGAEPTANTSDGMRTVELIEKVYEQRGATISAALKCKYELC